MATCSAKCKNGNACRYKAKQDGLCLQHYRPECSICFNGITTNQKFVLECNHMFHVNCVTPWLAKNNLTCPCCRTIVSQEFLDKHNINTDNTEKIVSAYEQLIFQETADDTSLLLRYIRLFDISLQIFSNEIISRSYIIKYISKKNKR